MYVIEKIIDNGVEKLISRALVESLNPEMLQELACSASVLLGGYFEMARASRLRRSDSTLADASVVRPPTCEPRPRFLQYVVVLDLLRDALLGESLQDTWGDNGRDGQDGTVAAATAADDVYTTIFALFVDRIAAFQMMMSRTDRSTAGTKSSDSDPEMPTWVPPVALDTDDPTTLFLHEPTSESGADISSEDAHIFPPPGESLVSIPEAEAASESVARLTNRLVHQDAESLVMTNPDGSCQRLWVVATYYETVHAFAVFDADLVALEAVEQVVDRICAFGGFANAG